MDIVFTLSPATERSPLAAGGRSFIAREPSSYLQLERGAETSSIRSACFSLARLTSGSVQRTAVRLSRCIIPLGQRFVYIASLNHVIVSGINLVSFFKLHCAEKLLSNALVFQTPRSSLPFAVVLHKMNPVRISAILYTYCPL